MFEDQTKPSAGDEQNSPGVDGKSAAIIDWQAASELLGGDRDFHCILLESAISEIRDLKPKLLVALKAGDGPSSHRLAHTMKGAARAVAAVRTTEAAAAVELAASQGEFDRAMDLLPRLEESIEELGQEIENNRDAS